jgi:NADPH:quinone reductase-like Zn-dependent oxidoreductase
MLAALFNSYGGPEVMEIGEAPAPHAGAGQLRIAVRAASVNGIDWKFRSGSMAGMSPVSFPAIVGYDAAGVVDEVGDGVDGFSVGDEVFGLGSSTYAEHAVLTSFVVKPTTVEWAQAAGLGVAGETAVRALDLLSVGAGSTVLIDGAAGGVGSVAVQIAVARGATVVATASKSNHNYLHDLGAIPIEYGDGLAERVGAAAPSGLDAVFDVVGKTPITELTALVSDPQQVVSIANFTATEAGARVTTSATAANATKALNEVATLAGEGRLSVEVQTFPLAKVGDAHSLNQEGHVRGKLVLEI